MNCPLHLSPRTLVEKYILKNMNKKCPNYVLVSVCNANVIQYSALPQKNTCALLVYF